MYYFRSPSGGLLRHHECLFNRVPLRTCRFGPNLAQPPLQKCILALSRAIILWLPLFVLYKLCLSIFSCTPTVDTNANLTRSKLTLTIEYPTIRKLNSSKNPSLDRPRCAARTYNETLESPFLTMGIDPNLGVK